MNDQTRNIQHRLEFIGFPPGELRRCIELAQKRAWAEVFSERAVAWAQRAQAAKDAYQTVTALQLYRWAAVAYHAAAFEFHLRVDPSDMLETITVLRKRAVECYYDAMSLAPSLGELVKVGSSRRNVNGLLRRTETAPQSLIVLVNGLDSLMELELQRFGDEFLARGISTLSVDLPAGCKAWSAAERLDLVGFGVDLAQWATVNYGITSIGVFGVSYGGNTAARLLASSPHFCAAVAVSPPGFFGQKELAVTRLAQMFRWSFGITFQEDVSKLAQSIDISNCPRPNGPLMLVEMSEDALFGSEHTQSYMKWANGSCIPTRFPGEHVGTSTMHAWLPQTCDWLVSQVEQRSRQCL